MNVPDEISNARRELDLRPAANSRPRFLLSWAALPLAPPKARHYPDARVEPFLTCAPTRTSAQPGNEAVSLFPLAEVTRPLLLSLLEWSHEKSSTAFSVLTILSYPRSDAIRAKVTRMRDAARIEPRTVPAIFDCPPARRR